jgi:hypothetical protein
MDYLGYIQTWIWILGLLSAPTVGVVIWARITRLPGVVVFVLALGTVVLMLIAFETVLVLIRLNQRLESLEEDMHRVHIEAVAEAVSLAAIREARVRIHIRDYDGALRAALECYSAAQSGNRNYIAHALDAIADALDASARDGTTVSHAELVAVRATLLDYRGLHSDPRAVRLKSLVDQYF